MEITINKVSLSNYNKILGFPRGIGWELKVKFNSGLKILVDMYPTRSAALKIAENLRGINKEVKNINEFRAELNKLV